MGIKKTPNRTWVDEFIPLLYGNNGSLYRPWHTWWNFTWQNILKGNLRWIRLDFWIELLVIKSKKCGVSKEILDWFFLIQRKTWCRWRCIILEIYIPFANHRSSLYTLFYMIFPKKNQKGTPFLKNNLIICQFPSSRSRHPPRNAVLKP